jgi:cation diffusion facilitator family transporter
MIEDSNKLSYAEGWISIAVNLALFALKYWAGIVTDSIAITADAWHTLSDSLTSIIVIVGVKISAKPADKEHPFGHGRAEWIAAIVIGISLALIAFNFISESLQRVRHHEAAQYGIIAITVTVISIVMKEALAQYAIWIGKKTGSRAVKADAWHHRSDALSSVIILVGIFFSTYFWWIDGVLGIIVALLILYAAFDILKDSVNPMLGSEPGEDLISQVRELAHECTGEEVHAHHFHLHDYGGHAELTFHIRLAQRMTLQEAHGIAKRIENVIGDKLKIDATIHIDPIIKAE